MSNFTLKELKEAISKHNKEMNNDIKVSIKDGKISFSSSKAESMLLQERMKRGPDKPKMKAKPKGQIKGQTKLKF